MTSIGNVIKAGDIDCGVGAGMESMSMNYGSRAIPVMLWEGLKGSERKETVEGRLWFMGH